MFCRHEWEKIHEYTTSSAFDQLKDAGLTSIKGLSPEMFEHRHFCILCCRKCGKVKAYSLPY